MLTNKNLISYMRGSGGLICTSCALEIISVFLGTGISLCAAIAASAMLPGGKLLLFTGLWQPFALVLALLTIRFAISRTKMRIAAKSGLSIKSKLRGRLFNKLFELGPAFTVRNRTGDVANTISNKVEWLHYYYTLYLPTFVSAVLNMLILLPIMFRFDIISTLICVISAIGLFVGPMFFNVVMRERGEREWRAHTEYYSDCLDSIQGMTALKAFNANKRRREYMRERSELLRTSIMSQLVVSMLETCVMELFMRLGSALAVAVAFVRVAEGLIASDASLYILFLTGAFFAPISAFRNAWHMGYRGVTASVSIRELLEQKSDFAVPIAKTDVPDDLPVGDVHFSNVSFAYNKNDGDVLHDVSFTIPQGTTTALVGVSGGGKSTIAQLLAAFYSTGGGMICVGDTELTPDSAGIIQAQISAVWQDSHIFYGSVYENIQIGKPDASRDEVIEAAKKANLHEMIGSLPMGYDTFLGENGMRFSGGERQRVALARAFLKNAPILIFDEATSSLDRKNEIEIQRSLSELLRGRTALIIAHRLSTIQNSEQICVVERGCIIAVGTHNELANSSSIYQQLLGASIGGE